MPLYEYQCDACGHRFEHIQKFSDPLLSVCPQCGDAIRKLVSSPAIQFKGTGWYVTDYAKKGTDTAAPEAEKSSDGKDVKTDKSVKTDKTKSADSTSSSDSSKKTSKSSTSSSSSTS